MWTGRRFRCLGLVDDATRESPALLADFAIGGERVVRVLDELAGRHGLPEEIVVDNGPEFTGRALFAWSARTGVRLRFIQPGKPIQNAFVESFIGRFRDECLNQHWFGSLEGCADHRGLAPALQPRAPTERARLRAAGAVRAPARRAWTR